MHNGNDIVSYTYLEEKVIPEFEVALKWYDIGIKLNIPKFILNNIRDQTITHRCSDMLQMWLQRPFNVEESRRPTWENMYKAMIAEGMNLPAEELKKQLTNFERS